MSSQDDAISPRRRTRARDRRLDELGILWALILGFGLSAVVQAVVRRSTITRLLGDDRPKTLAIAAGLGAASSSYSYAARVTTTMLIR
jgi:hypothetical protein